MTDIETTDVESTGTEVPALEAGGEPHGDAHPGAHEAHGHPSPLQYVAIGLLLSVVTGIEVGIYYIDMPDGLLVAILLSLAAVKFGTVAAFFMHLKFDQPVLRRLFVTGIVLAAIIYTIVLLSLDILVG